MLSYAVLQKVMCKVKINRSLILGEADAYEDGNFDNLKGIDIDKDGQIYTSENEALIRVQNYNGHYEISFDKEQWFDVCFDSDEELNEICELLEIVAINKHFYKRIK